MRRTRLSLSLLAWCSLLVIECSHAHAEEGNWGEFEFTLTLPLLYASSVVNPIEDTVIEDRPDWYTYPEVSLEWEKQLSSVRLTLAAGAALERYAEVGEADLDILFAGLAIELTDGTSDVFVPFLEYEAEAAFDPFFSSRTDAIHDVAAGFTSGFGFDPKGNRISFDSADAPGSTALEFGVLMGQRFADPGSLDRTFFEAGVEVERVLTDSLVIAMESALKVRRYNEEDRIDVRPTFEISLIWTPEWLTRALPDADLTFLFFWEKNISTVSADSYTYWEAGPVVTLAYEF